MCVSTKFRISHVALDLASIQAGYIGRVWALVAFVYDLGGVDKEDAVIARSIAASAVDLIQTP